MVRVTADGTDPLPAAMGRFLPASLCALLFVVGLVATCAGLGLPSRRQSITFIGRALVVLGGVGILAAVIPIAMGLFGTRATFMVMATSESAPKAEDLQPALDASGPLLTTGYVVLLVAMVLPLLAGLVGFQKRPTARWLAVAPLLAAPMAALAGLCYVVLFFLGWQQSVALEGLFTSAASTAKASEMAGHLTAILTASLIGCPLLMLMGAVLAMAGLLAPQAKRDG
jgi:hypothetical protein